jgi:hypothetical protein
MSRMTALFVGIAVLATTSVVAEAADGCGRGWYYNGRRCVPQDESGYYRPGYRRDYYEDRGPQLRLDLGGRRDEARYFPPNPSFRTWNHCPQNYTVQDGLCKPYTGR